MSFLRSLKAGFAVLACLFVGVGAAAVEEPCESFEIDLSQIYENRTFPDDSQFVSLPEGWRVNRSEIGTVSLLNAFGPDGAMITILASRVSEAKQSLEDVTASTVRSIDDRDGVSVISSSPGKICFAEKTYEFSEIYVNGLLRDRPTRLELHRIASERWFYQVQLWADPTDDLSWRALRTIRLISKWD
jgi:hypothetical protein